MSKDGSIRRHGSGYEARVTVNGRAFSATFRHREEAEAYLTTLVGEHRMTVDEPGYVYFVAGSGTELVKIGFSANPDVRAMDMQIGSPVHLEVLAVVRAQRQLEAALHRALSHSRQHGEWFRRSPELLAALDEAANGADIAAVLSAARRRVVVANEPANGHGPLRLTDIQASNIVATWRRTHVVGVSRADRDRVADMVFDMLQRECGLMEPEK